MGSKYFKKKAKSKIMPKIRKGTAAKDVWLVDRMIFPQRNQDLQAWRKPLGIA
jgi:hypothetical protein